MTNKKTEEQKRINVSGKRQITIPKRFYDKLGLKEEIICELRDEEIILRNVPHTADDSENILKDLVNRGFEGNRLIQEFQKRTNQNRPSEKHEEESGIAVKNSNGKADEQIKVVLGDLKDDSN